MKFGILKQLKNKYLKRKGKVLFFSFKVRSVIKERSNYQTYKYIMEAYLDRFNLIKVKVSTQYYQGKIKYFYLKNASTNINLTARIIYKREFENEGYNLYHLMVENVCLGEEYFIVNNYGMSVPVINYGIVNDPMFDRMFLYDGNDLGPNYTPYKTTFKVWAPTASKVKIEYILNNQTYTINMRRLPASGIFEASIKGEVRRCKLCLFS